LPLIDVNPEVWNLGYTGEGQTICVLDSGINYSHPDFGGCTQTQFLAGTCSKVLGGYDFVHNDANPMDDFYHGTHVAGIAAADGNIKGVAPDAKLIAVKVTNNQGGWSSPEVIDGIEWCIDNKDIYGISIITMSLGSNVLYNNSSDCDSTDIGSEIESAYDNDIFVVASSGNNGNLTHISLPACSSKAVSVGATYDDDIGVGQFCLEENANGDCIKSCVDVFTDEDEMVCLTNRGSLLDLLAPGCEINSTNISKGGYKIDCGTSMAAPHVAGVAALLLERKPSLKPEEIKETLKNTGVEVFDSDSQLSYKRINASNATNSLCVCEIFDNGCGNGCKSYQRNYTISCNLPACYQGDSWNCTMDTSCISGGGPSEEYTVCASGCDYTTINGALSATDENDKIVVNDSRTYSESLIMKSNTGAWLKCTNGAKLYGSGNNIGINITNKEGFYIEGCIFDYFNYAIYLENASHGDLLNLYINRSDVEGLSLVDDTYDVRMSNLSIIGTLGDHAIHFDGYDWSSSIVSYNKLINSNVVGSNSANLVWVNWGLGNEFKRNNLSGAPAGYYGLELNTHNNNADSVIEDNKIFSNYIGLYLHSSDYNQINGNIMCPSNSNKDFEVSGLSNGNTGNNNRCDNPENWDDDGTSGCTYICDLDPEVTLIFPTNNGEIDEEDNQYLVCLIGDEIQVQNVSIYTNISGSWALNQTKSITGTSNLTIFDFPAQNGFYMWNCKAFDNGSHYDWGDTNWTFTMNVTESSGSNESIFDFKEDGGLVVASFMLNGDLNLKGNCSISANCNAPSNSLIIYNSNNETTAYIDSNGNLCLEGGSCIDNQANCNPSTNAFLIQNDLGTNLSYINFTGGLCLTGDLNEYV
jgi:parallel beta-helix repeat protein